MSRRARSITSPVTASTSGNTIRAVSYTSRPSFHRFNARYRCRIFCIASASIGASTDPAAALSRNAAALFLKRMLTSGRVYKDVRIHQRHGARLPASANDSRFIRRTLDTGSASVTIRRTAAAFSSAGNYPAVFHQSTVGLAGEYGQNRSLPIPRSLLVVPGLSFDSVYSAPLCVEPHPGRAIECFPKCLKR